MRTLVLGATGLLGSAVMQVLAESASLHVVGTVRAEGQRALFGARLQPLLTVVSDLGQLDELDRVFHRAEPDVVINCVALRRQAGEPPGLADAIAAYSILPQRVAALCRQRGARFIQISSDGVYSGHSGGYTEEQCPDAIDVYGLAKILGEVREPPAVTIRTSIIGHELAGKTGLLEWFLAQRGECRCHARAIFSGVPAVVLAEILRDVIIPRPELTGIFHVASTPISKCDLLRMIAQVYQKDIKLERDERVVIDRSLNGGKFSRATGYIMPEWPRLIERMYLYQKQTSHV